MKATGARKRCGPRPSRIRDPAHIGEVGRPAGEGASWCSAFTGVGPVDRHRQHDRVDEPDCKVAIATVTANRAAEVEGTISFEGRTLAVTTADVTDAGAFLTSESDHAIQLGDGCIER